tara:strand:- start:1162 stop:1590 length:429 start_codon:yes stop_codon:yes gene_type:complete
MVRRRKAKAKRRRSRGFSLLNALEGYSLAAILSYGVAGSSPLGMITGKTDISAPDDYSFNNALSMDLDKSGAQAISLGDILQDPNYALTVMSARAQANLVPMAMSAFVTSATFKFGKLLLRNPIRKVNATVFKPLFSNSVRL